MLFINASAQTIFLLDLQALKSASYASTNILAQVSLGIDFLNASLT